MYDVTELKYYKELKEVKKEDRLSYHFKDETAFSRNEKIAFVDALSDNRLSVVLSLAERCENDIKSGRIKVNPDTGVPRQLSIKAWITHRHAEWLKENGDKPFPIDTFFDFGRIRAYGDDRLTKSNRYVYSLNTKATWDTEADFVDEVFREYLFKQAEAERKYFQESDEGELYKTNILNHPALPLLDLECNMNKETNTFNYIHREFTLKELQMIEKHLDALQKKAKEYKEKILTFLEEN
ncbi:MAG: hypothetical protein IJK26_09755 [Clostridia bacterium]|nr:hypothetical protein [Clostridia bacterium]